jgi:hypothetical protein
MEEVLGPELVDALRSECRALGVPGDRWHRVPSIARSREAVAVVILAEKIAASQGIGSKSATEAAAIYLGVEPDTVHSRLKRWHADAYKPAA